MDIRGVRAGRVGQIDRPGDRTKSRSVEAGDKIDIETWAKYKNKTSYSRSDIVGAMASILGGSFVGSQAGLEILSNATQTFQNGINLAVGVGGNGNDVNTRPYAYVYYLLYDRSFNPITQGWKRVSTSAGFDPGMEAFSTHEKLTIPTVNITEPGYIYVFVSNESENTEVWFDDLKVAHERSKVVAGADYYPFRLVMENREITRADYRYGYQGQFSEEEVHVGWNSFDLRQYDPAIGRWITIDPYGEFYSPYLAMGNNPLVTLDPDGGTTGPLFKAAGAFKYAKAVNSIANEATLFSIGGLSTIGSRLLREVVVSPTFWNGVCDFFSFSGIGIRFWGTGDFGTNEMGMRDPSGKKIYDIDIEDFNNTFGILKDFKKPGGSRYDPRQRKNVNPPPGKQFLDEATEVDKTASSIYDAVENLDKPDTISAQTVFFKNGKIYRLDTVKFNANRWHIIERRIDKYGNLIHK